MNRFKKMFVAAVDAWSGRSLEARRSYEKTSTDKGESLANMRLNVSRGLNRPYLETLYANFWSAARIVDTKPDDVFGAGIIWDEDDDEATQRFQEELKRLKVMIKVPRAVKAGRLFGTSLVIFAPNDGDFTTELDIDNIREGDISHLIIADKFRLDEQIVYGDPAHPKFGDAHTYRWYFNDVTGVRMNQETRPPETYIDIHASRCLRFDGIPALTTDGHDVVEKDRWGISVLARAMDDIMNDALLASSLPDVGLRACIPVIKKQGWSDVLSRSDGTVYEDEVAPETLVQNISDNLTSSKLMIIDALDEIGKLEVTTSGLNDIAKLSTHRLGMADGIPITRFTGESATGLSATGDGEARDWRIAVEDYRKEYIDPQWKELMSIVARNAGLQEVPGWTWGQIGDATFEEKVDTTKLLAETAVAMVGANIWDEEEAREYVNNSELSNVDPAETPEIDEVFMQAAKLKMNPPKV